MDANIIGNAGVGLAQGLERGLQNAYQINRQGMTDRLQIQKMAEDSKYKEQSSNMQQKEFDLKMREYDMKFAVQEQYMAFDAYTADGDVDHLNRLLKKSPITAERAGAIRFEKLNSNEPADARMLSNDFGISTITPLVAKNYIKAIKPDGSVQIMPMNGLYVATGYSSTKDKETRAKLAASADLAYKESQTTENLAKAAYYDGKGIGGTGEKTAMQKNADYLDNIDPALKEDYLKKEAGWAPTTTTKELIEVDKARTTILKNNPKFFETTYVPGTDEYRQMEPNIQKIEKNLGIKLNSTDKKEMADIKRIITLGDTAKKLTPEDTGMIDNLVGNVKKYVSDDAPAEAKNAYNQMMTTIRNSLYGATLPAAEMTSFTQAFGSLYQQDKAVKSALKTSLEGVKAKMEAFNEVGDEAVTHFRYGADAAKLSKIIDNLDAMIATVDGKQGSKGSVKPNIPLPSKTADAGNGDYKTPPPAPSKYQEGQRAKNPNTGQMLVYTNGKWVAE